MAMAENTGRDGSPSRPQNSGGFSETVLPLFFLFSG